MKVTFLGTGAGVPSKERNVTAIALHLMNEKNDTWLFDCGEGTQHQMLHTSVKASKINKIFITHIHGDHIYGLPGLLSSRSYQGATSKVTIYGPSGLKEYINASLQISQTHLLYPLEIVEMNEEGLLFKDETASVNVAKLDHGVPSFGFRIQKHDQPGSLLMEKVKEANIPLGPHLKEFKHKKEVTLPDGRTFETSPFIGPLKEGKSVCILGDTRYSTKGLRLAEKVDLLVHEATFSKSEERHAQLYYHSTTEQAATLALKARVNHLILTHISPRYQDPLMLEKEGREIFPNTCIANDLVTFTV
ncbi:ribonuclease Z [Alteribacter aurantiacus]|uniref:ribonuclease Z n=1 Tax=Alteribacter aurantiacus TaxID=254410 RepID=UPI0003FC7357|nr:ribonuclease Z [Alteribacter aurantiacus]